MLGEGSQYKPVLRTAAFTPAEEKAAIGIVEVPDVEQVDDRFYWTIDNPKDLDQLKAQWVRQINTTTSALLSTTDWMIIRKIERDIAIPDEITKYRGEVIAENNRLTSLIENATDVSTLIQYVDSQLWPQDPNYTIII
jgi:hypothetical protein